ncbi:HotDog domain-containing protein [Rostrohypoxylon terebratum]|nr:HotDog domain-containing protein [Rostrohypoxylon terebratum]
MSANNAKIADDHPILKPYSKSANYHQPVPDPVAHFNAIPWCAALLSDPSNLQITVPSRAPFPSGEANFVHKVMNTPDTVRACVTFIRLAKPTRLQSKFTIPTSPSHSNDSKAIKDDGEAEAVPASPFILSGGGRENGEDPANPFVLFHALVELGINCQSFPGIMHGGLYGVILDEVMGTAANKQTATGAYTLHFTTRFKRAIRTPAVVLLRGRVVRKEGRKIHVKGTIQDKDGNVMAEGEGLWLDREAGRSKL